MYFLRLIITVSSGSKSEEMLFQWPFLSFQYLISASHVLVSDQLKKNHTSGLVLLVYKRTGKSMKCYNREQAPDTGKSMKCYDREQAPDNSHLIHGLRLLPVPLPRNILLCFSSQNVICNSPQIDYHIRFANMGALIADIFVKLIHVWKNY